MVLHLSVILFTGGLHPVGVCFQGRGSSSGGGGLHQRGGLHPEGVCIQVGSASKEAWADPPSTMGYNQQVGGTHPTGMHSCFTCL